MFVLCDRGRAVSWFAHERLRDVRPSGSGSSLRRSIPVDPALVEPITRLVAELAWHGPAMLEFRDDGTTPPRLIEINGRFWGSLQLAVAAGADFPLRWVRLLSGETLEPSEGYRPGVTLRWLWGDPKRLVHIAAGPPPGYPEPSPRFWFGLREMIGPQPGGTRIETWDRTDPLPAVSEWFQGLGDLMDRTNGARAAHRVRRAAS